MPQRRDSPFVSFSTCVSLAADESAGGNVRELLVFELAWHHIVAVERTSKGLHTNASSLVIL